MKNPQVISEAASFDTAQVVEHISKKTNKRFIIRPFRQEDSEAVIDILNYFFDHTFAAFPDRRVEHNFIEFIKLSVHDYPFYFVKSDTGEDVGFAYIHPYDLSSVFDRVAEFTIFILPLYGGNGLGSKLMELLVENARQMGIESLLACISAVNEDSIKYHTAQGFAKCGRFEKVGLKKGKVFDIVWMQKFL